MAPDSAELRREVLLYVAWLRGAVGRFAESEVPLGVPLGTRGAASLTGGVATATRAPRGAATPVLASVAGEDGSGSRSSPASPVGGATPGPQDPGTAASGRAEVAALETLAAQASGCRRCRLCDTRRQVVFGEGPPRPRLLVVGEAPGAEEDASGRPFVGRAGQLLTRMLAAIGLSRADVYIANVLKCRPPENRAPAPDEVAACRPFLEEQLRLLEPELVLVLGSHAAKVLLGTDQGIGAVRGRLHSGPIGSGSVGPGPVGVRVVPTYHPAYLLRNPAAKREAWSDLQLVARTLGLVVPARDAPPASAGDAGSGA